MCKNPSRYVVVLFNSCHKLKDISTTIENICNKLMNKHSSRSASYRERGCLRESPECPTDKRSCEVKNNKINLNFNISMKEYVIISI